MSASRPILIASFPRSGTHLLMDALRKNAPACRPRQRPLESLHESYLSIDRFWPEHHNPTSLRNAERILAKAARPLLKTHGLPGLPEVRPEFRAFLDDVLTRTRSLYTVRDGRQVMCSYYAARCEAEPDQRLPFGEFMRQTDEHGRPLPRQWADHVAAWLDESDALLVRYEDLVRQPLAQLEAAAEHAGVDLEPRDPPLPRPITRTWQHRLARLLGRLESTNLFARLKIRPEEVFDSELDRFFDEHAGDMQRRLGYAPASAGRAAAE